MEVGWCVLRHKPSLPWQTSRLLVEHLWAWHPKCREAAHVKESALEGTPTLTVRLLMIFDDSQFLNERFPHLWHELGAKIRHNVLRETMMPEHLLEQSLGDLEGRVQRTKGDKSDTLGKPIHHNQNWSVALRHWQICEEVKCDVWPRPIWCWERH